jgi:hypothetical protein
LAQGTPDKVIHLSSEKEFYRVMDSLDKKEIAYTYTDSFGGGSAYNKRGTGKVIHYRLNDEFCIKTRKKGGELVFGNKD